MYVHIQVIIKLSHTRGFSNVFYHPQLYWNHENYLNSNVLIKKNCIPKSFNIYEHFTSAFWLHNNLCEFTALEHKIKRWFLYSKTGLKISGIQK